MDFRLSAEDESVRSEARAFADEAVAPGARARDQEHAFPEDLVQAAAAKGYLGLLVPERYDGRAAGNFRQCLILEEIARADASLQVTISVHNSLACWPIERFGTDSLKERWLPRMARGEAIGSYALTEPHSGSDAAALACQAVRDGKGWRLTGTKMWITTGARSDVMVVFARTDKDAPKAKGITAFVVDTRQDGVTFGKKEDKTGIRSSETVQVFLDGARVEEDAVLGEINRGFNYAMLILNGGRVGIATQSIGIAQAAVDACIAWLKARRFEGAPVRPTQDEDFRIAEMATAVDAARLLTWRAALRRDAGDEHIREASMAKLFASRIANEVCREAVALMGPAGWRADGDVERYLRDARVTEIYEGTTEVQKLVIARTLSE